MRNTTITHKVVPSLTGKLWASMRSVCVRIGDREKKNWIFRYFDPFSHWQHFKCQSSLPSQCRGLIQWSKKVSFRPKTGPEFPLKRWKSKTFLDQFIPTGVFNWSQKVLDLFRDGNLLFFDHCICASTVCPSAVCIHIYAPAGYEVPSFKMLPFHQFWSDFQN